MKRLLLFTLLLVSFGLHAQAPINDECWTLIDLGTAPICDSANIYTNTNATETDIGVIPDNFPPCFNGGLPVRDVWFKFTVPDTATMPNYTVALTGIGPNAISNPQISVYRGDGCGDLQYFDFCATSSDNQGTLLLNLTDLTPGGEYYLRINDWSTTATPNAGDFILCVVDLIPDNTVNGGGSFACSGTLFDSGGQDSTYQNDESFYYQICPTEPHACITFTLQYYNLGYGDVINIFAGDTTFAQGNPPVATIGEVFGFGNGSIGAVCYETSVASECMTIQFSSDGNNTYEGFAGQWYCSQDACTVYDLAQVDTLFTAEELALAIVDTSTTAISNVQVNAFNCAPGAYGVFTADNTNLGLGQGVILTSGSALNVSNPGSFFSSAGDFNDGGDADLDYLSTQSNGSLSQNACVLELDVFVASDQLSFEYIFGSEEYPEFVNSSFNDIFALLVSGPDIQGDPNINNQENIAVLNNGTTVEINSVNDQNNWQYYRNNQEGPSVCYDGLTSDSMGVKKSLTAFRKVTPCNTYHLKFAIADRGDSAYDSGVFISKISAGLPAIELDFFSGLDYLLENCYNQIDQLSIILDVPRPEAQSFLVEISGTAQNGVDYTLNLPSLITFAPFQTELNFDIETIADVLPEGPETIVIRFKRNYGCGDVFYTKTIFLYEAPNIQAATEDTVFVCNGSSIQLEASGALNYSWSPAQFLDNPNSGNPTATVATTTSFVVTGSIGLCQAKDTVVVKVISPNINAVASDYTICSGESIQLTEADNVNNAGIQWTPTIGLNSANVFNPVATPPVTTTYTATVAIAGCTKSAQVTIEVDQFVFPDIANDTLICQGYSVQLADTTTTTPTQYTWTPSIGLDNASIAGALATPQQDVIYTLVATSENNYCTETAQVYIVVKAAYADILDNDDYIQICRGESVPLQVATNNGGIGLVWTPNNGTLTSVTDTVTTATPLQTTWYKTSLDVGGCQVFDSILIRVDSLPLLELSAIPDKTVYCPGEVITLVSDVYDPVYFPDITYLWTPALYQQSPDSLLNIVITPDSTVTYTRTVTNNACEGSTSITINVVNPEMSVTGDTLVCFGAPAILNASPADSYSWSPPAGLSCADCQTTTANPIATTTYGITGIISGCPASSAITVVVKPSPSLDITATPNDQPLIQGTSVVLNAETDTDIQVFLWRDPIDSIGNTQAITIQIDDEVNCFEVAVVSSNGCTSRDSICLAGLPITLQLPNAFSPDGDNTNDNFNFIIANGDNITIQSFQIFDRWGKMVYNNDTPATGWNGRIGSDNAISDVYIYYLKITMPDGEVLERKGDITLIR